MMAISNTSPSHHKIVGESGPKCMGEHLTSDDASFPSGNFDCSICLDMSHDPVVTMCGHLFCWSCLHQWITAHSVLEECPVCKACVMDKIIPLYGRGRIGPESKKGHIPHRPSAHRSYVAAASMPPAARFDYQRFITPENHSIPGGQYMPSVPAASGFQHHSFIPHRNHVSRGGHSAYSAAGFGLFPALFGFHTVTLPEYSRGVASGSAYVRLPAIGSTTLEQQRLNAYREFVLYWFLILLAGFAILFFLLF